MYLVADDTTKKSTAVEQKPDDDDMGCFDRVYRTVPEEHKFVLDLVVLFGFLLFVGVLAYLLAIMIPANGHYFRFQVDSLEAKSSSSLSNDLKVPSPEPGLGLGLDLNVTLSVINSRPMVFDSLLVLLAHDRDNSVLSSKVLDGFYQRIPGQLKVEMAADVQTFPTKEDNFGSEFSFTLKVVGHYRSLVENQLIHRRHLEITCKGIKIALASSSNDITTGHMLGAPITCK